MDPKTKFQLFKQHKYFCSAPWNLLYVHTNGQVKLCTKSSSTAGNVNETPIAEILSGSRRKQIKTQMLNDQAPEDCRACHNLENAGDGSSTYHYLRNMYNQQFIHQDIDYSDLDQFRLGAVDLHWSSICDLKCITCWHEQSSSIAVEQGLPIQHVPTKTALQIIEYIVANQSTLTEVYLSGGEPTLIKYNLNLLEQLEKRKDLLIRVNTNMMWKQNNAIIQEILKFPNVMFTCSADNMGSKFEYIRRDASWSRFLDNLKFLRTQQVEVRINSVFFVLSANDLIRTIDFFKNEYQIENFTINQCAMGHTYLRSRNLPEHIKEQIKNSLEQAKIKYANNLNLIGSFNNCLTELSHSKDESYTDYFDQVDQLSKTNFKLYFPELA